MSLRNHAPALYAAFAEGDQPRAEDVDESLAAIRRVVAARYRVLGVVDVEEIASDVITLLFEAARSGEEIRNPAAWMLTVAHRKAYDRWQALQRTVPSDEPLTEGALSDDAEQSILRLIDGLSERQRV